MLKIEREDLPLVGVVGLLIGQVALFVLSFDAFWMISIFCTATKMPWLESFGFVHLLYLALFGLGVVSLGWRRGRLFYIALICVALLALPLQAWLVGHEYLYCDVP